MVSVYVFPPLLSTLSRFQVAESSGVAPELLGNLMEKYSVSVLQTKLLALSVSCQLYLLSSLSLQKGDSEQIKHLAYFFSPL